MYRRGFTLVELVVVISIVALAAAICFPSYLEAREKSETTVCRQNRAQLERVYQMEEAMGGFERTEEVLAFSALDGNGTENDGFSRLCPCGGRYSLSFDEEGNLRLQCNIHGR